MNEDNTSGDAGATQVSSPPATGTPASTSATLAQKPALTVEELLKRNAELEHAQKNATEEVERHRKKLSAYEKAEKEAEAAKKAAEEAQLSEIERIKKQHAEAEAKIKQQQAQLVTEKVKYLAKEKGIANPELIAPYIESKLEYDESTGQPTNLEKVLDDLIKGNPYLVVNTPVPSPSPAQTQPAQTQSAPPALPAMAPPRTSIAQPGTLAPGQLVKITDPGVFKRP